MVFKYKIPIDMKSFRFIFKLYFDKKKEVCHIRDAALYSGQRRHSFVTSYNKKIKICLL